MDTFVILRRNGWASPEELGVAAARSTDEGNKMGEDEIAWIRSYVIAEDDGQLATVCIYQAKDEETVRRHAGLADLPATEVRKVVDTVIVRPDPVSV
jgi:hypothetical protein